MSAVFTSTGSSELSARPTWAPTSWTPASLRRSWLAIPVMRSISWSEVPGSPSQWTRTLRSWGGGSGARVLSCGTTASPMAISAATLAYAHRGRRAHRATVPSKTRAARRSTGLVRGAEVSPRSTSEASAGTTARATIVEAASDSAYESTAGCAKAPPTPSRKISGSGASSAIRVP